MTVGDPAPVDNTRMRRGRSIFWDTASSLLGNFVRSLPFCRCQAISNSGENGCINRPCPDSSSMRGDVGPPVNLQRWNLAYDETFEPQSPSSQLVIVSSCHIMVFRGPHVPEIYLLSYGVYQ